MAVGMDSDISKGPRPLRSTLGGLRDALMKPVPEDLRKRHRRVHRIAEFLLVHIHLSQREIEDRIAEGHPDFQLDDDLR